MVLDEVHGSLAELITDRDRSLDNSFLHIVNDRTYFEVSLNYTVWHTPDMIAIFYSW